MGRFTEFGSPGLTEVQREKADDGRANALHNAVRKADKPAMPAAPDPQFQEQTKAMAPKDHLHQQANHLGQAQQAVASGDKKAATQNIQMAQQHGAAAQQKMK